MLKHRISLVLLIISINGLSQKNINNFALTLDVLGNGGLYSVNAEYRIGKINDSQINVRAGFGLYNINNEGIVGIPIGLNLLTGTKSHHLELGLGASYVKNLPFPPYKMVYSASEGVYLVPSIGYRFDKLTKGFIFKAYYSPFITVYDFFNEEKYITEIIQLSNGILTREQINHNIETGMMEYPTIRNRLGYFGLTVGYRF